MTYYLSIIIKILLAISIVSIIYLMVAFIKNVGFTKYLTKDDITQLYNYQWTTDELDTLNLIIVNRKTIFKLISIFTLSAMFCIITMVFLNNAKVKDVDDVQGILTASYCNNISDIEEKLQEYKPIMTKDVYNELTPDNIDNINSRYVNISSPMNEIRIISSLTQGNQKFIDFQILNNGLVVSNRRVELIYSDGKISKFKETLEIPVTMMADEDINKNLIQQEDDNNLEKPKDHKEDEDSLNKSDVNTKKEISNGENNQENSTNSEQNNLSASDIFN